MLATIKRAPHWLIIVAIAAALRLVNLGQESLWYDETFTDWLAKLPLDRMFQAIAGDVHPPLWYLIEWVNVRLFGDSEFALRLPAALFGIVLAILCWQVAEELRFTRSTALAVGVLAATMPGILYYGQEARMYTMLACFVIGAGLAAMKDEYLIFGVCCVGAVYSQNLGAIYVAVLGVAVLVGEMGKRADESYQALAVVKTVLALLLPISGWLTWSPIMIKQAAAMGQGFWIPKLTPGEVLWPLASMTMGLRIPNELQINVYAAAFGLTMIGLVVCRKWLLTRRGLIVLAITFGAPLALATISVLWRSVYLYRALIPSAAGMCLIWGYTLLHLGKPNRKVAQIVAVPMLGIALIGHYVPGKESREDWRGWVTPIKQGWQDGDALFYGSISPAILLHYYMQGYPYEMRPHSSDLNQSLSAETREAMGFNEMEFDQLPEHYKRVWLIVDLNPLSRIDEFKEMDRILKSYPHETKGIFGDSEAVSTKLYLVDFSK